MLVKSANLEGYFVFVISRDVDNFRWQQLESDKSALIIPA